MSKSVGVRVAEAVLANIKTASLLDSVKYHAPKIRTLDTVVGGLGGAAAGLATAGLKNTFTKDKKKNRSSYLRYAAGGALAGAGLGNVLGDRARRYVSNAVQTSDYGSKSQVANLMPGSMGRFMDLAVNDKINLGIAKPPDVSDMAAREAWRRGMDLPVRDPLFVENAPHTYGYNPEKLDELKNMGVGFVLGRSHSVPGNNSTLTRKDRFDFDWHKGEHAGFNQAVKDWFAGREKVTSSDVDTWYPLDGGKRKPGNVIQSLLLRAAAQAALGPRGGIKFELHEQGGKPISQEQFLAKQ